MTLYIIAHKVRGERAFDVAEPMAMADGLWWIIPTSGHRAYPYWFRELSDFFIYQNMDGPPEGLPDHYPRAVRGKTESAVSDDLLDISLEELGL